MKTHFIGRTKLQSKMINQERHEMKVRGEIEGVLEQNRFCGELIRVGDDINERFLIIKREDIDNLSDELYRIVLRELKVNGVNIR